MQGDKFDIVFRGKLASGFDEATVRTNLARLFKKDESRIAPLFSGGRTVLKRGLDRDTADKYRNAFRNAGAIVAIVQDRQQADIPSEPPPEKPDFGREVKAAYAGKASFQIDEGPPVTAGKASFAVDDSAEPETPADDDEPASSEDQFDALEMPGVAAPPVEVEAAAAPEDPVEVASSIPEIDTSSLSIEGESPDETDLPEAVHEATDAGRASYAIDEGPVDSGGGVASFAIDEGEPESPEQQPVEEPGGADDFAPLEMSPSSLDDEVAELSAETSADVEPERPEESPVSADTARISEPGAQLSKPVHLDPPEIDTSALSLSEVGITMDESERLPTPQIDTGDLATDENFVVLDEAAPVAAPDIDTGDMDVMEVGVTVDESKRPPPADIDTSGLSAASDYEALDEAEKPIEPDIDISNLNLEDDG